MAEGRDLPSIKDGSDADFEFCCTPCGEDNITEEAVKYCPECQEYLCTTCTRHHGRQKATRSHKLLAKGDAKHGSAVAMTAKCRYHPDRDIEMYCGTHDMVYCTKCIATEHRGCNSVNNIEELPRSQTQQKEIQRLQDENVSIHTRLVAASKQKQKNISSLEEQRREIQEKIKDDGEKLKEHIDTLKNEATDTLNRTFTETKGKLESEVNMITDAVRDIEKSTNQLKVMSSMDVGQQFVYVKLVQKSVAEAKTIHEESEANGTKAFGFTENTELSRSIITASGLGQVLVTSENNKQKQQYKIKSRKDVNVKMQSDKCTCFISDVCQLHDGTIILTDHHNRKIKRLDINYNLRDHYNLDDGPMGICCTGQNEVAVKMGNDRIRFISVGTSLTELRDISIENAGNWGMTYCSGELWVSTASSITVYNKSGTLLKSIIKDLSGQNMFKDSTQYMAVSGDKVVVTDSSDGAVCIGQDGKVRRQLRDQRLSNTKGACVSKDKTVFLSGYNSHNIVIFSGDGTCLGELVTKEQGLTYPSSLWYDDNRNCIIVACLKCSNRIHILEINYCYAKNI